MSTVLIVLLLIGAVWLFFFKVKKSKKTSNKALHGKYHCVEVCYSKGACEAVRKLDGKRILSADAPVLPLRDAMRKNVIVILNIMKSVELKTDVMLIIKH